MTSASGFMLSRKGIRDTEGPTVATPEQGREERGELLSISIKNLGADRSEYVDEIGKLWDQAKRRFLAIGQYLVMAKERLPHGAFEAMVLAELPFGKVTAWQLRTIAEAVRNKRIQPEELPSSYTTAFRIVQMPDEILAQARVANIVRADVQRPEVAKFLAKVSEEQKAHRPAVDHLVERRDELKRDIAKLERAQRDARQELAVLEAELREKTIDGHALKDVA